MEPHRGSCCRNLLPHMQKWGHMGPQARKQSQNWRFKIFIFFFITALSLCVDLPSHSLFCSPIINEIMFCIFVLQHQNTQISVILQFYVSISPCVCLYEVCLWVSTSVLSDSYWWWRQTPGRELNSECFPSLRWSDLCGGTLALRKSHVEGR